MPCEDYNRWIEAWQQDNFMDGVVCPIQDSMGAETAAMFIYGGINIYIYARTGSVIIPVVVTIILGSMVISQMPSAVVGIAAAVLLVMFGIVPVLLIRRIER